MKPHRATRSPFSIRYLPSWILLGVLRLIIFLPYSLILWLGAQTGALLRFLVPYRRTIVEINLSLCFPELNNARREMFCKNVFHNIGMSLMEMALCWWSSDRKLTGLAQIKGLQHLLDAQAEGKGVLLLTGHFSAFEIAGRLLSQHIPLCVSYREFRNPVFHRAMVIARKARFERAIHRYDSRGMVQALRDGKIVWYAPDQDPGIKHSTFAPFFGKQAATLTTTARLAKITGARVLPFFVTRLPGKQGYQINIKPPLENFPTGDAIIDATTINAMLEQQIRVVPEQYYWVHRRFKTRPPGEAAIYQQKPRRLKQAAKQNR